MAKILYTIANDATGQLVKAESAEKGKEYFCSLCHGELLLRKSGR